ncbi:MAG TPA: glycine--tRNA ligase subunit beta [Terriglobia bacterium]|nr:glycine--tRNA ligase subunit beta [Terriglobia bacterium]
MSESTLPLLVEIGCEEIPARFLQDAADSLGLRLVDAILDERLNVAPGQVQATSYWTPRRLVAHVAAVQANQPDLVEDVTGPPAKVAFDAEGKPTRAAESFAAKNGVAVQDLLQVETPKGLYLAAKKTTRGRAALDVLAGMLPQVIKGMSFPKSMVWETAGIRFVRPIRWIVALLGEGESAQVVPFEVAGVRAGNVTRLHRLVRKPAVAVSGFNDYATKLRRGHVEIDPAKRRRRVQRGIKVLLEQFNPAGRAAPSATSAPDVAAAAPAVHADMAAATQGGGVELIPDAALADWIAASTEWPTPILGSFEPRFLELPREILITVMRGHQKYFALETAGSSGGGEQSAPAGATLAPQFATVLNVPGDPEGIIRRGHERVLTARLEDAKFFWHADQRIPLRDRVSMLERVTYQAKLGSYADKVKRMKELAQHICAELENQGRLSAQQREHALHGLELCKCDLTTQMVQEFTELQGVVGGLYARSQGEPDDVWQAIYDHYKPVNVEDECPRSVVGAVVSLADKLDAVVAGFSAGLEPTGSSDPFGLRRAGNGIIKLAAESLPGLDLYNLATRTVELERQQLPVLQGTPLWERVDQFFRDRSAFFLQEVAGLSYDTIRAVLSPSLARDWGRPADAVARGRALDRVRESDDFRALAAAAKRTRNIINKSASAEDFRSATEANPSLFASAEESELHEAYKAARAELDAFEASANYAGAFHRLAKLRPAVDRFFDKVMVMDEDVVLRANRLRLLADLNALAFTRFADLSEVESGSVGEAGGKSDGR